jgi:hypothetical protein
MNRLLTAPEREVMQHSITALQEALKRAKKYHNSNPSASTYTRVLHCELALVQAQSSVNAYDAHQELVASAKEMP